MDSFLFDMTGLDGEPWSAAASVALLTSAAEESGHTVQEGPAVGDWRNLDLVAGALPSASLMVAGSKPGWAFTVIDGVLGDEDEPVVEAQAAAVEVLRACAAAVPLYLGTAVWPFGPETPPSYDTRRPFAAAQAGSVMFVSAAYAEAILGGPPDPPKGWTGRAAGGGDLLVVEGNLLLEPEDPAVRRLMERLRPSR